MKPLIALLVVFLISSGFLKLINDDWEIILSGNIAMCVMLCFTALGHFKFTKGMAMMIPRAIPHKIATVYITGVFEIILGLGLLFDEHRKQAGICIIVFLILMFPANIYAAINHINYEKANHTGKGVSYLWFRMPMQVFLILWAVYFSLNSKV